MARENTTQRDRRAFLKYTGVGTVMLAAGLSGCSTGNTTGSGGSGGSNGSGGSGGSNGSGGSGGGSDAPNEVLIGGNHPLSGSLSSDGTDAHNGVQLALTLKNESGGIKSLNGAQLRLLKGDNEGSQELSGQVTRELISEGASVVMGAVSSPATLAAVNAAEREQVPFVISVGSDSGILTGRGLNYGYRPQPHQRKQATNYANMQPKLIRDAGGTVETAAHLYVDNTFGQETNTGLKEELPGVDIELLESIPYSLGASSLNTQITQIKQQDPDLLIITSYTSGGQLAAQAMKSQNYQPDYIGCCTSTTFNKPQILSSIGNFVNGALNTIVSVDATDDYAAKVTARFQKEYDSRLSMVAGISFAAAQVVVQAIEQAGSANPQDINQTLNNITVQDHIAAMPEITFNKDGENPNSLAAVNQVQDGEPVLVRPKEYASAEFDASLM